MSKKPHFSNFKCELLVGRPQGLSQGFGWAGLEPQGEVAATNLGYVGSGTVVRLEESLGMVMDGGGHRGLSSGTRNIQRPGGDRGSRERGKPPGQESGKMCMCSLSHSHSQSTSIPLVGWASS